MTQLNNSFKKDSCLGLGQIFADHSLYKVLRLKYLIRTFINKLKRLRLKYHRTENYHSNGSIDPIPYRKGGRLITMLANIVLRDHDKASSCIKPT